MGNPEDDCGRDAFLDLLSEGTKGPGPKAEALEALTLRPVWLATWEPRAEGYRTLMNASGEEALAVFSSERQLKQAAASFDWLESDGAIATHRAIGGDILRHAWTREYAFVVIDIGAEHSLEYERAEIKAILRELDTTGPFRTSRPPAPADKTTASSSFPPPVEPSPGRISTVYSMAPRETETIDRLSDAPTKPHEAPYDSEPPTQPRASVHESEPAPRRRKSSRPAHKPKSDPAGTTIEEVRLDAAKLGDGGTYGAARIIPPTKPRPGAVPAAAPALQEDVQHHESTSPGASAARGLSSDVPTKPAAQPLPTLAPGKLKLPAISPVGVGGQEPAPPDSQTKKTVRPSAAGEEPRTQKPPRVVGPSIGDGIKLVPLLYPPAETLLKDLADVLRGYFEVEWASYCQVARPAGEASPAVGLRITDNYRDNVTAIIKELCQASRTHDLEIDVLLIDGHDLLREAREKAYVFYPWKPKG